MMALPIARLGTTVAQAHSSFMRYLPWLIAAAVLLFRSLLVAAFNCEHGGAGMCRASGDATSGVLIGSGIGMMIDMIA